MSSEPNGSRKPWADYWEFRAEIEPELAAKRPPEPPYENLTPRWPKPRKAYGKHIK